MQAQAQQRPLPHCINNSPVRKHVQNTPSPRTITRQHPPCPRMRQELQPRIGHESAPPRSRATRQQPGGTSRQEPANRHRMRSTRGLPHKLSWASATLCGACGARLQTRQPQIKHAGSCSKGTRTTTESKPDQFKVDQQFEGAQAGNRHDGVMNRL